MFIYSKLRVIRPHVEIQFKLTLTGLPSQCDILSCNYELMNEACLCRKLRLFSLFMFAGLTTKDQTSKTTSISSDKVERRAREP